MYLQRLALCLTAIFVVLLVACTAPTGKADRVAVELPSWVLLPIIEGGIAASDCVKSSGDPMIDRKQVIANARARLVQQIEIRAKLMDMAYASKINASGGSEIAGSFESVSKQMAQRGLSGVTLVRVESVMIDNEQHLCTMLALAPPQTDILFKNIVETSNVELGPQDEADLYKDFKAYTVSDGSQER